MFEKLKKYFSQEKNMPLPLIGLALGALAVGVIYKVLTSEKNNQIQKKNIKVPNIFISHRWALSEEYKSLIKKLDENNFKHLDYSVPKDDSFDTSKKKSWKKPCVNKLGNVTFLSYLLIWP